MKVYTIVDLGFGDAGKGTIVDYLSCLTPNTLIVRYNGGPQAAHNVMTAKGVHHTFAQFGSGTLVPTVKTYLSKYMWIEPLALLNENEGLKRKGVTDALSRLSIDKNTQIVTPFHRAANRIKEKINKHGSCGMGMGEAVYDSLNELSLTVDMLCSRETSLRVLRQIQNKKTEECQLALMDDEADVLRDPKAPELIYDIYQHLLKQIKVVDGLQTDGYDQLLFEGAGGILLDENYGFHPHTMWTTTTTENVRKLWHGEMKTIGVVRTYSTRHGNGPFVTEKKLPFIDKYNTPNKWQGRFRTGLFDLVATKYAMCVNNGIDALAVTHTDEVYQTICDVYDNFILKLPVKGDLESQQKVTNKLFQCEPHTTDLKEPFIREISDRLNKPVFIESFGERSCDKRIHDRNC